MTGWQLISRALDKLESCDGFQEEMEPQARLAMDTLMSRIQMLEPHGKVEPYHNVTASQRLMQTPISQGWTKATVRLGDNSVGMRVGNLSQHVMFFIGETIAHRIPKSGDAKPRLTFYWENPSGKHIGGPGIRRFKWVDHPGTSKNLFVKDAAIWAQEEMASQIAAGVRRFIKRNMEGLK